MLHSFRLHNSLTWGRAIALAMVVSPGSEAVCQLWWNYSKTLELGNGEWGMGNSGPPLGIRGNGEWVMGNGDWVRVLNICSGYWIYFTQYLALATQHFLEINRRMGLAIGIRLR
ncbi:MULTISPECIES: hypothetical protein [unclassified Tolypothrix]|uniref:hypothetical protein n=1 Tax=unclassified Tolypothrix TaxID=2649714 RepID=UPI0005EAA55D|nr:MULTISPECIES: hypothetical protein [unclassified Tolypothrix]EKF02848.1 hypothetical protein FDUTEX481_05649 [Tolypothrix sp. PCC 7601]UYD35969.1 hypothetical protein HG267_09565 [Tolypothrix sp. PCC 7601]BAY94446.1 hypothetical protein NIES3275_64940 [Microchaete diplosiphon NIES-3275]